MRRDYKNIVQKKSKEVYSPRQRVKKRKRFKIVKAVKRLSPVILTVLVFVLIYLFVYSPWLKVKNILVSLDESSSQSLVLSENEKEEIKKQVLSWIAEQSIWPKDSLITLPKQKIISKLKKIYSYPQVTIKQKFPRTLEIVIKPKEAALLLQISEKEFYVDSQGYVIKQVETGENKFALPILLMSNQEQKIVVNKRILQPRTIDFLKKVNQQINEKFKGLSIISFSFVGGIESEIKAETNENWQLYLTTTKEVNGQISLLRVVYPEIKRELKGEIEFIDVSLGDRVIYK